MSNSRRKPPSKMVVMHATWSMTIQKLAAFLLIRRRGETNGNPLLFVLLPAHTKNEMELLILKEVDRFSVLYAYGLANAEIGHTKRPRPLPTTSFQLIIRAGPLRASLNKPQLNKYSNISFCCIHLSISSHSLHWTEFFILKCFGKTRSNFMLSKITRHVD